MKSMKRRYKQAHSRLASLTGTLLRRRANDRDEPRPAVAPFSSSEPNGMMDEEERIEVGYPPEVSEEDDDVMMDFVSGR